MIRHLSFADPRPWTAADLLEHLGDIPLYRIRTTPPPGTATERDLIEINDAVGKEAICELIDGTLVEKDMGAYESYLAIALAGLIREFVQSRRLGFVFGSDGPYRLPNAQVRVPDVSFVSSERLKLAQIKAEPILTVVPDLGIEVVSRGNTRSEMTRKLNDYFNSGIRLIWYVYPRSREVHVFAALDNCRVLTETDVLDGGQVLPGFALPLKQFFGDSDEQTDLEK